MGNAANPPIGEKKWYLYLYQSMGGFLPSNPNPMICFVTKGMYRSSHQYPITWKKATKHILWEEPGKLIPIWYKYGCFCFTRFLYDGIIHHEEYTQVFHSIFHSMGEIGQIHPLGRTWEIGTQNFSKVWVFLFNQIPITWFASSQVHAQVFPSISHSTGKAKKLSYRKSLGNWYPYFCQSVSASFLSCPMV